MTRSVIALFVCIVTATLGTVAAVARAQTTDGWLAGVPALVRSASVAYGSESYCHDELISVGNDEPVRACVFAMDGWRYARYVRAAPTGSDRAYEQRFVISIGADTKMYVVHGLPETVAPLPTDGGKSLVYYACCVGSSGAAPVTVYRDFIRSLKVVEGPTGIEYGTSGAAGEGVYGDDGEQLGLTGPAVMGRGRWLVGGVIGTGFVRVDLRTLEAVRFSDALINRDYGSGGSLAFGATDDGTIVFVTGTDARRTFFEAYGTQKCGDGVTAHRSISVRTTRPCPSVSYAELYSSGNLKGAGTLRIDADGDRLTVYERDGANIRMSSLARAGTYALPLTYLGLGDSFASGEGDTRLAPDGYKYYAPYTDVEGHDGTPTEKCHQSTGSYPYLLRPVLGLTSGQARSVACSGAKLRDVAGHGTYAGQGDRLGVMVPADMSDAQDEALSLFIPGRVRQVDFVRRYAPLAATLGIGGNDVGFQPVLAMCAHPWPLTTCPYAADPTDRRNLGEAIRRAFSGLRDTYRDTLAASPGLKLYVTGYPRFVDPMARACPLDVNLDVSERLMVDQGVRYMNDVIEAAAMAAGAQYVDIEDAFAGHKLCEAGEPYVNPIVLLLGRDKNESFHPNASGQAAIARAMTEQTAGNLLAYNHCAGLGSCPVVTGPPPLPAFFGDPDVTPPFIAIPGELIALAELTTGKATSVVMGGLMPGSAATLELHSSPVLLDEGAVGPDGTVTLEVTLDATVAPGYHTLHLHGETPSGEPADFFQVVWVDGPAPMIADVSDTTDISLLIDKGNLDTHPVVERPALLPADDGFPPATTLTAPLSAVLLPRTGGLVPVAGALLAVGVALGSVLILTATCLIWRRI